MTPTRVVIVSCFLLLLTEAAGAAGATANPPVYVTIYRDDAVAFQVRRDRVVRLQEGVFRVWLRWLWAEPQKQGDRQATATLIFGDVDCNGLRLRELAVMYKDRDGKLFGEQETSPDEAPWRSFEAGTGAGAAVTRLCDFLPELFARNQKKAN